MIHPIVSPWINRSVGVGGESVDAVAETWLAVSLTSKACRCFSRSFFFFKSAESTSWKKFAK